MKRITLRVPDHQHAALSRLLTLERAERGNRYSLNDLCARLLMMQLSYNGASVPRTGAPAPLGDGTVHILRTPPPPPVPRTYQVDLPKSWPWDKEEPQPERSARPNDIVVSEAGQAQLGGELGYATAGLSETSGSTPQLVETATDHEQDGADPEANESAIQDDTVSTWVEEAREQGELERAEGEGMPDGTDRRGD